MTVYGWDASNHDWARRGLRLGEARKAGISMFTHKVTEGNRFYRDPWSRAAQQQAMTVGFPVLGGYHVLHPGSVNEQADWYLACLDQDNPHWRNHGCFIHQIDAEKFNYMSRPPNLQEIITFGNRIIARTGCSPRMIVAYAPKWLYGETLKGLPFKLWASNYGSNPATGYRQAYPGDAASAWAPYSGQTPLILQYGSQTTIGQQPICDANAIRVSSEAALVELFKGKAPDTKPPTPLPTPTPKPPPAPAPSPSPSPNPSTEADEMKFELIQVKGEAAVYAWNPAGAWWHVPNPAWLAVARKSPNCIGYRFVSKAEFDMNKAIAASARAR